MALECFKAFGTPVMIDDVAFDHPSCVESSIVGLIPHMYYTHEDLLYTTVSGGHLQR